ncbi:MAG: radical SAM protein [Planctomycetota bacterium]|jgi:pyruvate formate lyase activating enzyme
MAACAKCGKSSEQIAEILSLCADCVCSADAETLAALREIHARSRQEFGLPGQPPDEPDGLKCNLCQNKCRIPQGDRGYCGVRRNENGHLMGGSPKEAYVSWYFDPLPTNCVADWVCPGDEQGYVNLAVFYEACTFDCLFCQNWHYRQRSHKNRTRTAAELAESVTANTACICYFGGDPTCQLPHALDASRLARNSSPKKTLRICWETNGSMNPDLLNRMMTLSLESNGCVKFDLKAMNKNIHLALCGVDNTHTLQNFAAAAKRIPERPDPPPLVASTLLVPGYVDAGQINAIASFIADLDPDIPYALLGFHGDFLMTDLPPTTRNQADQCLAAAKDAGLKRVRIGNVHILR